MKAYSPNHLTCTKSHNHMVEISMFWIKCNLIVLSSRDHIMPLPPLCKIMSCGASSNIGESPLHFHLPISFPFIHLHK